MAWGRRCDLGCESWPDDDKYKKCPVCGDKTTRYTNLDPISEEDAAHVLFEHFYEKWDAEHDAARLEGDAPDARGKYASSGPGLAHDAGSTTRPSA